MAATMPTIHDVVSGNVAAISRKMRASAGSTPVWFNPSTRTNRPATSGSTLHDTALRIGSGDFQCHVRWRAAYRPQQVHGFGPRELFTQKTRNETTAPNLAASFHTAESHQQVTPRRGEGLAGEKVSENHAPSQQKLAGKGVSSFIGRGPGMRKIK